MFSLSLLSTAHPLIFQHKLVRSSIGYYPNFNLTMDRSPGFGSNPSDCRPIKTRFPYASPIRLSLPLRIKSLTHYTKGTQSQITRIRSHSLYAYGFRFYFTPLTGVLFAFPSRYWFTIGQLGVFSLGGWSPHIQSGFLVSRPTRFHTKEVVIYGTITLYRWTFQTILLTSKMLKGCSNFARRYFRNLG